jgi:hypothetical protein
MNNFDDRFFGTRNQRNDNEDCCCNWDLGFNCDCKRNREREPNRERNRERNNRERRSNDNRNPNRQPANNGPNFHTTGADILFGIPIGTTVCIRITDCSEEMSVVFQGFVGDIALFSNSFKGLLRVRICNIISVRVSR